MTAEPDEMHLLDVAEESLCRPPETTPFRVMKRRAISLGELRARDRGAE